MPTATATGVNSILISEIQRGKKGLVLRSVNKEHKDYINMRNSIETKGLVNAISVRENPDVGKPIEPSDESSELNSKYILVDGDHRLTAFEQLSSQGIEGFDTINATVLGDMSDTDALLLQCVGNAQNNKTPKAAYARALFTLLNETPMTQKDLARKLNKSQTWVSLTLDLVSLPEKVQKLLDNGKIKVVHGTQLNKIYKRIDIVTEKTFNNWVRKAQKQTTNAFAVNVDEYIKKLEKKIKDESRGKEPQFEGPTIKLSKKQDVIDLYIAAKNSENDLCQRTLAWVLNQSQEAWDKAKQEFDTDLADFKNKVVARDAKKACKKMKIKFEKEVFKELSPKQIVEFCCKKMEALDNPQTDVAQVLRDRLV